MATTEAASGPRYAPDDPSLPTPWKGLIDGSTGVLYYWNPETNVTQYERPASLTPPLPQGPPPATTTPKMAAIPGAHSMQGNGMVPQDGQQVSQYPQHGHLMGQQMPSYSQNSQMPHAGHQQSSQFGQAMQQHGQVPSTQQNMMQHPGQQMMQHQQMPPASAHHIPHQMGQQAPPSQNSQVPQEQMHQYSQQQQMQYMAYQQSGLPQGLESSQQQTLHSAHGQASANQQSAYPPREEPDFHHGNQSGFSPSQVQQVGASSLQNLPTGTSSVQMPPRAVHPGQLQQFGGTLGNMPQPSSFGHKQQSGTDLVHHQNGSRFHNQMDPAMYHIQQPNMPPLGLRRSVENNFQGGVGNEYYSNGNNEGPTGTQQPKIAAIPLTIARSQQEMGTSGVPFQNAAPSQGMHNMYSHAASGPPFSSNALVKPSYVGPTRVPNLSPVQAYLQLYEVTATGGNVPAPFMTFEDTGFPPEILRDIYSAGFASPTPIQAQTWPIALQSRDIVAIAKTGSGKTLGYLMPAFILLRQCRNDSQNGPTVLVLAPTRELATQIQAEVLKFGRASRISCTCLYGGAPKGPQLKELDRGADIVVATPGRLNDILEMKRINFGQVSLLILDEADRMLDMGFEPQIRKIVNEIPPRRQTLMYTATWPKEVKKIASDLLVNPVQVNIGNVDELAANKSITQYVEVVPQMEKQRRLEQILKTQERGSKVIIFCSTKRLCDQLARSIGRTFGVAAIHGDKSQGERDYVLNQFRSGKCPILVATDVAARGLDIKDIRVVVNYDFPTGVEDYVHRIGRTGRAGATGVSYTFFSEQDWKYAADLIKVLEGANQQVPPEVRDIALRGGPGFGKDRSVMNRFDSGSSMRDGGFGGRGGMREGGFGGRGGMRDGGFGGRGGMRDGGFGGRSGMKEGGFGGRSGMKEGGFGGRSGMRDGNFAGRGGMRDGNFGGPRDGAVSSRGGRNDFFGGRGNRGRGFGGPGSSHTGFDRIDRGPTDRYNNMDVRGRGGRGHGRFDNRFDSADRGSGRSRSPETVRTWGGYSSSRSRSRSRSGSHSRSHRQRSRSWTRSRSRSRSWSYSRGRGRSYSHSPSRGRSYSHSPSRRRNRSRSPSYERYERPHDQSIDKDLNIPKSEAPTGPGMSPMPPGRQVEAFPINKTRGELPMVEDNTKQELEETHITR